MVELSPEYDPEPGTLTGATVRRFAKSETTSKRRGPTGR